jgi:hypothetical protein
MMNKTHFVTLLLGASVAFGAPANTPVASTKRLRTNAELTAAGEPTWANATGVTCNSFAARNPDPTNQYAKYSFPFYLPDVADWPSTSPAPTSVKNFTDDEKAAIRAGIHFWNNSGSSIELSLLEGTQWATDFGPSTIYDYNGTLLKVEGAITTMDDTPLWGVPELDDEGVEQIDALGITYTSSYPSSACAVGLTHSYILFNFFQPTLISWDVRMNGIYGLGTSDDQNDFWSTATHEIGHAIGLEHDNTISSFVDQTVEGNLLSDLLISSHSYKLTYTNGSLSGIGYPSSWNVYGSNWSPGAEPEDAYEATSHNAPPTNPLDRILVAKSNGTLWSLNQGSRNVAPAGYNPIYREVYYWEQVVPGGTVTQAAIDAAKARLSSKRYLSVMSTGAGANAEEALTRSETSRLWGSELFGDDCLLLPASNGGCPDPTNLVKYPSYDQLKVLYGEYPVTTPPAPRAKKNRRKK